MNWAKLIGQILDSDAMKKVVQAKRRGVAKPMSTRDGGRLNEAITKAHAEAQTMGFTGSVDDFKAVVRQTAEDRDQAPAYFSFLGQGGKAPITPELRMDRAKGAEAAFEGELAGGSAERTILGKASDPSVQTSEPVAEGIRSARSSMEKTTGTKQVRTAFQRTAKQKLRDEGLAPSRPLTPEVSDEAAYLGEPVFDDAALRATAVGEPHAAGEVIRRKPPEKIVDAAVDLAHEAGASDEAISAIPTMSQGRLVRGLAKTPEGQAYDESQTIEALLGRTPNTVDAQSAAVGEVADLGALKPGAGGIQGQGGMIQKSGPIDLDGFVRPPNPPTPAPTVDDVLRDLAPHNRGYDRYYDRPLNVPEAPLPGPRRDISPRFGNPSKFQGIQGKIDGIGGEVEPLYTQTDELMEPKILSRQYAEPDIPGQEYIPGMEDLSRFRGGRPMSRDVLDERYGTVGTPFRTEIPSAGPMGSRGIMRRDFTTGSRGEQIPRPAIKEGPLGVAGAAERPYYGVEADIRTSGPVHIGPETGRSAMATGDQIELASAADYARRELQRINRLDLPQRLAKDVLAGRQQVDPETLDLLLASLQQ